ncbi:MAG TPA: hypothetical protein VK395_27630 [Gemmataceae bacterium]|nr:hypothetical protein [Gemmataceae bacterium]
MRKRVFVLLFLGVLGSAATLWAGRFLPAQAAEAVHQTPAAVCCDQGCPACDQCDDPTCPFCCASCCK